MHTLRFIAPKFIPQKRRTTCYFVHLGDLWSFCMCSWSNRASQLCRPIIAGYRQQEFAETVERWFKAHNRGPHIFSWLSDLMTHAEVSQTVYVSVWVMAREKWAHRLCDCVRVDASKTRLFLAVGPQRHFLSSLPLLCQDIGGVFWSLLLCLFSFFLKHYSFPCSMCSLAILTKRISVCPLWCLCVSICCQN